MSILQASVLILIACQIGDWYTTYRVISNGGRETNPLLLFVKEFLERAGIRGRWAWLTVTKLFVIVGLLSLLFSDPTLPLYADLIVAAVAAFYVGVVWHNWRQIGGG